MLNFEVVSSSSVRDFQKRSFCDDDEVVDGSGGMNASCSQPEVADDIISSEDLDTFVCCTCANLWTIIYSSFLEKIDSSNLCNA